MSHTLGPWEVDAVTSEALHDIIMSNPPLGEGNPILLASVYEDEARGTCPTKKQANANARLIAAAPDLLAACEQALEDYHGRESPSYLIDAIAKAKGGSQ